MATFGFDLGGLFGKNSEESEFEQLRQLSEIINRVSSSEQDMQTFSEMLQNFSSQESSVTTTLDPATLAAIQDAIGGASGDINRARQDKATAVQRGSDMSQDAMSAAIQEVIAAGIGNVAESGTNAGAYNSTVTGELGSRLGADAARAGAQTRLDAIVSQQQLASNDLMGLSQVLQGLFDAAKGGVTTNSGTQSGSSSQQQSGESSQQGTVNEMTDRQVDEETTGESSGDGSNWQVGGNIEGSTGVTGDGASAG